MALRQECSSAPGLARGCVVQAGEVAVRCADAVEAAASGSSEGTGETVAELSPVATVAAAELGIGVSGVEVVAPVAEWGTAKDAAGDEVVGVGTAVVHVQAGVAPTAHTDAGDAVSGSDRG